MVQLLPATVMVVALSLATTQPFTQSHATKHSDFKWNTRKIGNKKVATLTIRKDEERDRRSIPLAEVDEDVLSTSQRRHHHRHHHGDEVSSSIWLPGGSDAGRHREEGTARLTPLYLTETSFEDSNLMQPRINDVLPGAPIREVLNSAGFRLTSSLFKNATQRITARRHNRRGNGGSRRIRIRPNENRNNQTKKKRKRSKNCRRLKGKKKRRCRAALRKCRRLRGRDRRRCRANAVNPPPEENIFAFIKGKKEMTGQDACHYKYLKECSRKVGMLTDSSENGAPVVKCHFREEFLKCMEEQRLGTCNPNYKIRGNMKAMRKKIRDVIWTPSSCLISEVVEG